jgi:hypothetical protein
VIDRFKAQGEDCMCMCVVMHRTYSKRGCNLSEYTGPPALPNMHCIEETLFPMLTYWMRCAAACALLNYNTKENSNRYWLTPYRCLDAIYRDRCLDLCSVLIGV